MLAKIVNAIFYCYIFCFKRDCDDKGGKRILDITLPLHPIFGFSSLAKL